MKITIDIPDECFGFEVEQVRDDNGVISKIVIDISMPIQKRELSQTEYVDKVRKMRLPESYMYACAFGVLTDYVISSRMEVEDTIEYLTTIASENGFARISDYYVFLDVNPEKADFDYGWYKDSLSKVTFVPVRAGYIIKFPKPIRLPEEEK